MSSFVVNPVPAVRRRTLLRMAGAGATAIAGGGLLTACRERESGQGTAESVQQYEHLVPRYVPWTGVQLPASDFLPGQTNEFGFQTTPGLLRYPQRLVRAVPAPVGQGNTYTSLTPLWAPPPDFPNEYFDAIIARWGTTVEFAPRDGIEYGEIVSTILAAQDHPQITMIPGWNITGIPGIQDAIENLFADLTPILSGDISERWPLLANLPTPAWLESVFSGKLKALPQVESNSFGDPVFMRQDILDELSLAPPTTVDELLALGRELTDPARNRWAFGAMELAASQIFRVPFQDWRLEPDGSLVNAIETDELRQATEFLRQLYDEGLVHPDNAASAEADLGPAFRSGEIIIRNGGWGEWSEALSSGILDDNPNFNQQPMDWFAYDGGEPQVNGRDPAWGFTFLHKDLSQAQIEEILDVMNWIAAPFGTEEYELHQYGVEGVHFNRNADRQPELTERGNTQAGAAVPTVTFLCGHPAEPVAAGGDWPGYVQSRTDWNTRHLPYLRPGIFAGIKRIEPASLLQANQSVNDKLEDLRRGRTPMSEWNQIVADWRRTGGDEGRDFYQQALANRDAQLEGGG
jgi:putative aldouronate transport system substrate-binding protein